MLPALSPPLLASVALSHHPLLPQPDTLPDACQVSFDAVATIRGELFFFKAGFVWRLRRGHLQPGYPALASRHWQGLPSPVDAAFEDAQGHIWFFQGEWGMEVTLRRLQGARNVVTKARDREGQDGQMEGVPKSWGKREHGSLLWEAQLGGFLEEAALEV